MDKVEMHLDVRGKFCPIPLVRFEKAIREIESGSVMRIVGDDPVFEETMRDHIQEKGHRIVDISKSGSEVTIVLQKG